MDVDNSIDVVDLGAGVTPEKRENSKDDHSQHSQSMISALSHNYSSVPQTTLDIQRFKKRIDVLRVSQNTKARVGYPGVSKAFPQDQDVAAKGQPVPAQFQQSFGGS